MMTWSAPAEKETSFRQAIVENRVNVVRSFLGPDHVSFDAPSTWPGYGTDLFMTPLEYAARQNQARVVQILVEEFNANKELSAEPGYTPLLISLSKGNVEMIECLLRAGANVRAADGRRGRTALMHAILGNLEDSHRGIPDLLTPIPTRVTELNAYLVRMRGPRERVVRQLLARGASVHSMDANGETALIHAIRKYDYGVFNAIMESCPNVNASDNSGLSALSLSILADHDTCANRLLDRGAEPNVIDANGNSALILSIKGRQYSSVTRLIERGADPNAVDENGMSPLILSIKANEYSYVTRLLDRGADPNVTDENGIFALILSIRANEYSYVTRLLDRGANPNVTDENGNSALILSIQAKEYSYVTRLLDRGAEPNVTDKNGISALILSIQESEYSYVTRLLQKGADPNARDMNTGRSPLIVAVRANEEAMVRRLLEHGANPNSADGTDQTPLMYAAKLRIDDHHQQMNQQLNRINQRMRQLEQLVEQRMEQHMEQLVGANFARRRRRRRDERDPTITGIIPLLVAYGAEINTARVRDGHSALTLASRDGILEHVTTLLSFDNTDCDRALVTGETALILAARGGHDDVIGLLMGKGACVDAAALDGLTALIAASMDGHAGTVILLLQNGANAFARRRGQTALLRAATGGHVPVIRALLDHSMRVLDSIDDDDRSALVSAMQAGHCNVVDLLMEQLDDTEKRALVRREDSLSNSPLSLAAGVGRVNLIQKFLPWATKLQIIRSQAAASTVRHTKRRVQIQHLLFSALVERCHGWVWGGR